MGMLVPVRSSVISLVDARTSGGKIPPDLLDVFVGSGPNHAAGIVPDPGDTAGIVRFLREDGTWNIPPSTGGTVTSVTVAVPTGFAVLVTDSTANPIINIFTSLNGVIKGNGSGFADAVPGTDYYAPGSPIAAADVPTIDAGKVVTGTLDAARLPNTAVTPGSYTLSSITVDATGRVTAAASEPGPLAISAGGTGAVTAQDARDTLGLGSLAVQSASAIAISGGTAQAALTDAGGQVYNVKAYGARGDGVTDDTAAINAAIVACYAVGGGVVLFPPGTYLCLAVQVKSGVMLSGYGATLSKNGGGPATHILELIGSLTTTIGVPTIDVTPGTLNTADARVVNLSDADAAKFAVSDYALLRDASFKYGLHNATDGAMTAGQTTLTSATAGFTSSDVGQPISVTGAGVAGAQVAGTIVSRADAQTVTLSFAASTTVTGATVQGQATGRNQEMGRVVATAASRTVSDAIMHAARTVADGVATATSTTITSATAAFDAGDVGRTITINGGGLNGSNYSTSIASVIDGQTATVSIAPVTSANPATFTLANTAILYSPTAGFTSADVGKSVTVAGVGAAGATLTTTILALRSVTAVTLATSASTTVSAAAATVSGAVTLADRPIGSYTVARSAELVRATPVVGARIEGLTLTNPTTNNTGGCVYGLLCYDVAFVDCKASNFSDNAGYRFDQSAHVLVTRCAGRDGQNVAAGGYGYGVQFGEACHYVAAYDSDFENIRENPFTNNCRYAAFVNNRVTGAYDSGWNTHGSGNEHCLCAGNVFSAIRGNGAAVGYSTDNAPDLDISIVDNQFSVIGGHGIACGAKAGNENQRVMIAGNKIRGYGYVTAGVAGIACSATNQATIRDNAISGLTTNAAYGIQVTGCSDTWVRGNEIRDLPNGFGIGWLSTTRTAADGAIASGSPNLTASGSFTSSDVGKSITVTGAGAAGATLSTTILSVTSATQVVLAANAATTVSANATVTIVATPTSRLVVEGSTLRSISSYNLRAVDAFATSVLLRNNNSDTSAVSLQGTETAYGNELGTPGSATYPAAPQSGVPRLLFAQVTPVAVANTTTATSLTSSTNAFGSVTLPAGTFIVGKVIEVEASGFLSTLSASPGTLYLSIRLDSTSGTSLAATGNVSVAASMTNRGWSIRARAVCVATGSTATVQPQGEASLPNSSSTNSQNTFGAATTAAQNVNTATTHDVMVTATWSVQDAANTITCTNMSIRSLN